MTNTSSEVLSDLGALHRASIWENIILKAGLNAKGIDIVATPSPSPLEGSPRQASVPLPEGGATAAASTTTANGVQVESLPTSTPTPRKDTSKKGPRETNATALKHLTHGLPNSLSPFFQGKLTGISANYV